MRPYRTFSSFQNVFQYLLTLFNLDERLKLKNRVKIPYWVNLPLNRLYKELRMMEGFRLLSGNNVNRFYRNFIVAVCRQLPLLPREHPL